MRGTRWRAPASSVAARDHPGRVHRGPTTGLGPGAAASSCSPHAGGARRVGHHRRARASASPRSSTRSAIRLTGRGHRVAVLAVDPSSTRTGGSILGDKTRMARLAVDPAAFIRPVADRRHARRRGQGDPRGDGRGGGGRLRRGPGRDRRRRPVRDRGRRAWSTPSCCSRWPAPGDQLQGIKKGVLELADVIAVNKADGEHARDAQRGRARARRRAAPDPRRRTSPGSRRCSRSALEGTGLASSGPRSSSTGRCSRTRAGSRRAARSSRSTGPGRWCASEIEDRLAHHPKVRSTRRAVEREVRAGTLTAALGAETAGRGVRRDLTGVSRSLLGVATADLVAGLAILVLWHVELVRPSVASSPEGLRARLPAGSP